MKPTIKNIRKLVSQRKVIRGVDPFELNLITINKICEICVDEVKVAVVNKTEPEWKLNWKSCRVLSEEEMQHNYKPIPRLERLIQTIIEKLQDTYPMKVCLTRNAGPSYVLLSSRRNTKPHCDWIRVPDIRRFPSNKLFYNAFLHELGHASCSRNRLCLKFGIQYEEEIAVDTVAAILCFLMGINVWEESISYSQNQAYGSKKKKEDHILFIKTARQWRNITNKTKHILKYFLSL